MANSIILNFYLLSLFHRKAISRSGLQHLTPVQNLNLAISNGPVKEPRMALEWSVRCSFYKTLDIMLYY